MNSITDSMTDLQPHQVAAQELAALWASISRDDAQAKSGLSALVSDPRLLTDESDWTHVEVKVTIWKDETRTHRPSDYRAPGRESFTWRMGLGLIDWKVPFAKAFVYGIRWDDRERFRQRGIHAFTSRHMAAIIQSSPAILNLFAKTANPAEVLARVCSDAQSANQAFVHWCADFGSDPDSRKALAIYELCQNEGVKARRLIDGTTFDKLAELANQL